MYGSLEKLIAGILLMAMLGCDGRRSAMEDMKAQALRRPKTEEAVTQKPSQEKKASQSTPEPAKRPLRDAKPEEPTVENRPVDQKPSTRLERLKLQRELADEQERIYAAQHPRRRPARDAAESDAVERKDQASTIAAKAPQPPPIATPSEESSQITNEQLAANIETLRTMRQKFASALTYKERTEVWAELVRFRTAALRHSTSRGLLSGEGSSELSGEHENQVAEFRTQFQFDTRNRSDVALLISSDMATVVAAYSPPGATSSNHGGIEAWNVFTGRTTQTWPVGDPRSEIDALQFLPDQRSFVTVPVVGHYQLDSGDVSLPLGRGVVAIGPWSRASGEELLAVGVSGAPRMQKRVLHLLRCRSDLEKVGGWNSYEAMVSAVCFANRTSRVAFAVRERGNHRLLIGDASSLSPESVWQIEEHEHSRSWYSEERGSRASVPGITAIAFSPDDQLLVAYGTYRERDYRATIWTLDHSRRSAKMLRKPVQSELPILVENKPQAVRFIGDSHEAALETAAGVTVVDMKRGGFRLRELRLEKSRRGRPVTAFSPDHRWFAVGDEHGRVTLWSLETGEGVSLTPSGRPAQSGPIVGIAFAALNATSKTSDYLVTAGEENSVKLWSLTERIGDLAPAGGPLSRAR